MQTGEEARDSISIITSTQIAYGMVALAIFRGMVSVRTLLGRSPFFRGAFAYTD